MAGCASIYRVRADGYFMTRSTFTSLSTIPDNEIGRCMQGFVDDPDPSKVNLTVGAYLYHDGKPRVLPSVRAVYS